MFRGGWYGIVYTGIWKHQVGLVRGEGGGLSGGLTLGCRREVALGRLLCCVGCRDTIWKSQA